MVVFALHQALQWGLDIRMPIIDSYLDPFLAPTILLGLWLYERQLIWRAPALSWFETAVATLLLAVIFEEVFPRLEEGFSRDLLDYLAYALGGLYFYWFVNRSPGPRTRERAPEELASPNGR